MNPLRRFVQQSHQGIYSFDKKLRIFRLTPPIYFKPYIFGKSRYLLIEFGERIIGRLAAVRLYALLFRVIAWMAIQPSKRQNAGFRAIRNIDASIEAIRMIRPVLGRPIILQEKALQELDALIDNMMKQSPSGSMASEQPDATLWFSADEEEQCALLIIGAQDEIARAGGKLVKKDAKDRFGGSLTSHNAFERAWSLARRQRPELGGSGRPLGTKKNNLYD